MQHLVVPTFVLNPKRQVVIWNRACERLTGVTAAEVLGTNQHWRAFYETRRYCLADLVALGGRTNWPIFIRSMRFPRTDLASVPRTGA